MNVFIVGRICEWRQNNSKNIKKIVTCARCTLHIIILFDYNNVYLSTYYENRHHVRVTGLHIWRDKAIASHVRVVWLNESNVRNRLISQYRSIGSIDFNYHDCYNIGTILLPAPDLKWASRGSATMDGVSFSLKIPRPRHDNV